MNLCKINKVVIQKFYQALFYEVFMFGMWGLPQPKENKKAINRIPNP